MAGLDKILVVVILVLSSIFLYSAVTVVGNEQKVRDKAQETLDAKDVTIAGLQKDKEEMSAKVAVFDATKKQLAEANEKVATIPGLNDTIKAKDDEIAKREAANAALTQKITALEGTVASLSKKVEEASALQAQHFAEIQKLKDENRKLDDANKDIKSQKEKADEDLKAEKADRLKEVTVLKERIRILEHPGEGPKTDVNVICQVQNVVHGEDFSIVQLDKGTLQGLAVGMKLFVYNNTDHLKGTIQIYEMQGDNQCLAKIVDEVEGKKIEKGDFAAVKNW